MDLENLIVSGNESSLSPAEPPIYYVHMCVCVCENANSIIVIVIGV
jgi:hypothetical protein